MWVNQQPAVVLYGVIARVSREIQEPPYFVIARVSRGIQEPRV